jgi:preprotein translocase subunit SecF
VFVLFVFGGPGVHGFAFAMLVGVMVGTYSSIGIAAPMLLILRGSKSNSQSAKESPVAPATDPAA